MKSKLSPNKGEYFQLLSAKMQIPPKLPNFLYRKSLFAALNQGVKDSLTLVSAPSGYGKSSLVSQWVHQCNMPVGWLTFDKEDGDIVTFLHYLIGVLRKVMPNVGEGALAVLRSNPGEIKNILVSLINEVTNYPALTDDAVKHIIVIDDFHTISENIEILNAVSFFIHYLPLQLHVIIITRTDPKIQLRKLKIQGKLHEIRSNDLKLSYKEIKQLFKLLNSEIPDDEYIEKILHCTDGWITGVLLSSSYGGTSLNIDQLRGFPFDEVIRYLDEEVFASLPDDLQNFMLQTSVLSNFTSGLCDAILDRTDSKAVLQYLEKESLFITPLDDRHEWYRYQSYFHDLLSIKFETQLLHKSNILLSKASEWFEEWGDFRNAIMYSLKAENYKNAARLLSKAECENLMFIGEAPALLDWLSDVPESALVQYPKLSVTFAWCLLVTGKTAGIEKYIDLSMHSLGVKMVEPGHWPESIRPEVEVVLGQVAAIKCALANIRRNSELAIELATYALAKLPENLVTIRVGVMGILGDAYRSSEKFELAIQTYAEAIEISKNTDNIVSTTQIIADMGLTLTQIGRLHDAEWHYLKAIKLCQPHNAPIYSIALINYDLGNINTEWNKVDSAEQNFERAIHLSQLAGYKRILLLSYLSLAKLRMIQGNLDDAESLIDKASQLNARSYDQRLDAYFTESLVLLALYKNDIQQAKERAGTDHSLRFDVDYLCIYRCLLRDQKPPFEYIERKLEEIRSAARSTKRIRNMIETEVLLSAVLMKAGKKSQAKAVLESAMAYASDEGYIKVFLPESVFISPLLVQMSNEDTKYQGYSKRILDAFSLRSDEPGKYKTLVSLTEREKSVLRLVRAGLRNREISEELFISFSTVKTHIYNIFTKLGVTSRVQAVIVAENLNLI
jgi:LuxR family transcriptional regulator, maltose regulon positive regulatory protein